MEMMDLLGKEVVNSSGTLIGIVKNVLFDDKLWQVVGFNIQLDEKIAQEFEMKKLFQNYLISIDVAHIGEVGEKITLKTDMDEIMTLLAAPKVPS